MNLASLKTNKKQIIALVIVIILTALIGFYGGRYYERKAFQTRFTQIRGEVQGRRNNSQMGLPGGDVRFFERR